MTIWLTSSLSLQVSVFFGGIPIKKDEDVLKNNCPHIVVGTPGRILALAKSGALKLGKCKYFVLDECDRMIGEVGKFAKRYFRMRRKKSHDLERKNNDDEITDMRADVQQIVKMTPTEKQVMMFSATLPKELRIVAKKFMQDVSNGPSRLPPSPLRHRLSSRRHGDCRLPLCLLSTLALVTT